MTAQLHSPAPTSPYPDELLTFAQQQSLHRAVAKIVALGAQVGVSADQMIMLLQCGLTVGELLDYLKAPSGAVA